MRVFFTTLGCKLNQAEVDRLARQFMARGHRVVGALEDADLHVVNTCTVTSEAARDSRKAGRRAARDGNKSHERGPARTVLTGCWSSVEAETARALEGVDLVVENRDKERLVDLVAAAFPSLHADTRDADAVRSDLERVPISYVPLEFGPARALVKIEDGCDMRCAFCIIPRTRGAERSRGLGEVVDEVRGLEAAGHAEIVLTGVQISAYRDGDTRLPMLLDAIFTATSTSRIRLTSIAPWELDAPLLDRLAHPRLCRHVHLSLQSGDDRTLRRMRRPYTAARFAQVAAAVRERVPGVALTTDVIVGFPGETDAEHEASRRFVAATRFARVHVFSYSPRHGTEAATLADHVGADTQRARMREMLETATAAENAFRCDHVGSTARVLWEGRRAGRWLGTTDNYLRVFAPTTGTDLRGTITETRLLEAVPGGLLASG